MDWSKNKPTEAGIYQVRGFNYGQPKRSQVVATVVVEKSRYKGDKKALVCNLHESNSEPNHDSWSLISDFSNEFEWRGPFVISEN